MYVHVLRREGVCLKILGRVLLRKHEKDGLTRFVNYIRYGCILGVSSLLLLCFLLMSRLVFHSSVVLVCYISQEVKETKKV